MKITGFRNSLRTLHRRGRHVGDAIGAVADGVMEVPVFLVETGDGPTGVSLGPHTDVDRVSAVERADLCAVTSRYDRMLDPVFRSDHGGSAFGPLGALFDRRAKLAGKPLWRTLGAADGSAPGYAAKRALALDDALAALYRRRLSAVSPAQRSRADWTPIATRSAWIRQPSCCGATRGGPR